MNTTQQRLTTRAQIIALREEGLTVRAIADRPAVSTSTVKRWIRRYAETGILTDLGIKKTTSPTDYSTRVEDAVIIAAIRNNLFNLSPSERHSAQTVRSRLHEADIQHRVPAIKERLTDHHRTGRLQFAQQYVGEDPEFWSRVVFTDEKIFASTNHRKIHLWRPNCTRYDRAHIYEVAGSGHVTLNVWCYISLHDMGDVFQIQGSTTHHHRPLVFMTAVPPTTTAHCPLVFMTPAHCSTTTTTPTGIHDPSTTPTGIGLLPPPNCIHPSHPTAHWYS
ncbi:putative Transposable element Tc1 transposase-like 36, partial [Homarus americanus]